MSKERDPLVELERVQIAARALHRHERHQPMTMSAATALDRHWAMLEPHAQEVFIQRAIALECEGLLADPKPDPKPAGQESELQRLRAEVDELIAWAKSMGGGKTVPEPKRLAPWVDGNPDGPGEQVTLRWPDKYSVTIHLTKTPPRIEFNGRWFDRVDDPTTGEFLGLYVQRGKTDQEGDR